MNLEIKIEPRNNDLQSLSPPKSSPQTMLLEHHTTSIGGTFIGQQANPPNPTTVTQLAPEASPSLPGHSQITGFVESLSQGMLMNE